MNIPNDNNIDYRLKKFVEYQHKVPPVHRPILIKYADEHNLNPNELVLISWLMSNTYNEITTLIMFEEVKYSKDYKHEFRNWYNENEDNIQFGSAKKYNKIQKRFLTTIDFFFDNYGQEPYKTLKEILSKHTDPEKRYEEIINFGKKCKNHGRFSADLYNEILIIFQDNNNLDLNIKGSDEFDWANCSNLTSAVLNIMYKDELADRFDAGKLTKQELKELEPKLLETVKQIQNEIQKQYNVFVDTPLFVTKLCSFRNLFKNARYGGYHHDRQLEYILNYNKTTPKKRDLLKKILTYRAKSYPANLLGEKGGWKGIRKERKKLWTKFGLTGVEPIQIIYKNLHYGQNK